MTLTVEQINGFVLSFAPKVLLGLGIFIVCWITGVLLFGMAKSVSKRSRGRREVYMLLGKTAYISLFILGVISALGTLGMNVSALIASLGLTGFALGFALKDAVSNILAGALIIFYRPFKIGNRISVTGFEGVVEDIDLRYTTLKIENRKIIIPNATLFSNPVSIIEDAIPVNVLEGKMAS